jgi:hypothetical protein
MRQGESLSRSRRSRGGVEVVTKCNERKEKFEPYAAGRILEQVKEE